ncbi:MAG: hypothetical protein ACYSVY_24975 [Planctomycetota bacterium]
MNAKPSCKLCGHTSTTYFILFAVRDTLSEAGLDGQVDEFLRRTAACRRCDEMVPLAMEYIEFEE